MSTMHITITKRIIQGFAARITGESFISISSLSNVHLELGMSSIDSRINNINMTFSILFDFVYFGIFCKNSSLGNSFELPLVMIGCNLFRGRWVINIDLLIWLYGIDTVLEFGIVVIYEKLSNLSYFLVNNQDFDIF